MKRRKQHDESYYPTDGLARLLKDERSASLLPQTDLKLAMGSAAALIKYLSVMQDPSNFGQYQLYQHDLAQFMKLDAAALKALNLMPGARDGVKSMSLYGLLNHCKTPVGSRLLSQWLKQPLMKKDEIEKQPGEGWAKIPDGNMALRRIPFLAKLRNQVLITLEALDREGEQFDTVLFLNDVVFSVRIPCASLLV